MRDIEFHDMDTRRRFGVAAFMFSVFFVVLIARLFQVQILDGDQYRERSRTSAARAGADAAPHPSSAARACVMARA